MGYFLCSMFLGVPFGGDFVEVIVAFDGVDLGVFCFVFLCPLGEFLFWRFITSFILLNYVICCVWLKSFAIIS